MESDTKALAQRIMKVTRKPGTTVINTFTTFFLLSYTKLAFVLLLFICPFKVYNIDEDTQTVSVTLQSPLDPGVNYLSKLHIPQMIVALIILLFATLLPCSFGFGSLPYQSFQIITFSMLPQSIHGRTDYLC